MSLDPTTPLTECPYGNSVLHFCAQNQDQGTETVKYFSKHVSNFSSLVNLMGQTPLHFAAISGNLSAYKAGISAGIILQQVKS